MIAILQYDSVVRYPLKVRCEVDLNDALWITIRMCEDDPEMSEIFIVGIGEKCIPWSKFHFKKKNTSGIEALPRSERLPLRFSLHG